MKYPAVVAAAVGLLTIAPHAFAGDLKGTVRFLGAAPRKVPLIMNGDPVCMREHKGPVYSETVVVNGDGTMANVIISVKEGPVLKTAPPPAQHALLSQKGCVYIPHVVCLQTGQALDIVNDDPTLHNVHSLARENPAFNRAQPRKGMSMTVSFDKPEIFKIKCEVHPWMSAYVGVFTTPFFAVTGNDGTYTIRNLPAGDYTIEAWQELYGTREIHLHVKGTGVSLCDFSYPGK